MYRIMKTNVFITKNGYSRLLMVILMIIFFWGCESVNNEAAVSEEVEKNLSSDSHARQDREITGDVDVIPEPEEGLQAFLSYIGNNIRYPEEARKQGIQGKVFIGFVVNKDGSISNVAVEKGLGHGLDEEAVRVISSYDKKWKPGISKGKAVNTKLVLPVTYAL
jgi:periplasmic protein TonB